MLWTVFEIVKLVATVESPSILFDDSHVCERSLWSDVKTVVSGKARQFVKLVITTGK